MNHDDYRPALMLRSKQTSGRRMEGLEVPDKGIILQADMDWEVGRRV
jgi:hypothetical protein